MSTSYYRLREPITRICIKPDGSTDVTISIWTRYGWRGDLMLLAEEARGFLHMFAERGEPPALRTSWGGKDVGAVVHEETAEPLSDDTQLISEYGELLTAGQVRGRAGAKRADGMPTELFGYEGGLECVHG